MERSEFITTNIKNVSVYTYFYFVPHREIVKFAIMRKFAIRWAALAAFALLLLLMLSGCDFLRGLAGRPTSEDIARKRDSLETVQRLRAEEAARLLAAEQRRADSLAARERYVRDSLSAEQELRDRHVMRLTPAQLKGLYHMSLDRKYYVITGSYRERANALKKQRSLSDAGYESEIISFYNGFHAIGAGATDHVAEALSLLKELLGKKLCPTDAWILVNE